MGDEALSVIAERSSGFGMGAIMRPITRIKVIKNQKGIFIDGSEVLQIECNGIQLRLYLDDEKYYMIFDRDGQKQKPIAEIHELLMA